MVQKGLDQWFLRQDVIDQLLQSGDDDLEGISAYACLLYTSPSPRDLSTSRMPSSA